MWPTQLISTYRRNSAACKNPCHRNSAACKSHAANILQCVKIHAAEILRPVKTHAGEIMQPTKYLNETNTLQPPEKMNKFWDDLKMYN